MGRRNIYFGKAAVIGHGMPVGYSVDGLKIGNSQIPHFGNDFGIAHLGHPKAGQAKNQQGQGGQGHDKAPAAGTTQIHQQQG